MAFTKFMAITMIEMESIICDIKNSVASLSRETPAKKNIGNLQDGIHRKLGAECLKGNKQHTRELWHKLKGAV